MMGGQEGQANGAHSKGAPKLDPAIREETARRYDACHRTDTFSDLVRRSSFSKEDRRLLEDWLAATLRDHNSPTNNADIGGIARIWQEALQIVARCP
jgi:hypothetical protein